jgi:hypothetical protein
VSFAVSYRSALSLLRQCDDSIVGAGILATSDLAALNRTIRDGLPEGWFRARVNSRFGLLEAARGGGARQLTPRLSARRA